MADKKRILVLVLIMAAVAVAATGAAIWVLYDVAFAEVRMRLVDTALSQARLIEAIFRHERGEGLEGARDRAISLIKGAHDHGKGLGRTGEFTLAQRQGDRIVFILRYRRDAPGEPKPILWDSRFAEPMRRSLSGRSGTVIGLDYRGVEVLAAHESVSERNLGIVAKIDLAEIRAPFIRAGGTAVAIAALVIAVGTIVFFRISNPMIRRIEESEERYALAVEALGAGVWDWDFKSDHMYISTRLKQLIGFGDDFPETMTAWQSRIHPDDRALMKSKIDDIIHRRTDVHDAEYRILHKDGHHIWLHSHGHPFRDETGQPVRVTGLDFDVTERRRAEERTRELQRELTRVSRVNTMGEMAASLAHELNQPLTAITNYAKGTLRRLKKGRGNPDEFSAIMDRIAGQALRAGEVIRRIRGFVEPVEPRTTAVDVNVAIRETLPLLAGDIQIGGVAMELDLSDSLPMARADSIQVQQVTLNLARNAIEAMTEHDSEPRRLKIGTSMAEANAIAVTVEDTGPGIPADVLERVFDPFFTTKNGGLGMGLTISRSIVGAHGGRLEVASEAGKGTTFQFTLPVDAGGEDDQS